MRRPAALAFLALLAAAGCGHGDESVRTATVTTTRPARESSVLVYFLRDVRIPLVVAQ